jgi:AraC-like DNA-binding protein
LLFLVGTSGANVFSSVINGFWTSSAAIGRRALVIDEDKTRSKELHKASARKAWASAVAQVEQQLGNLNAKRSYDDLGNISVGSTDVWLDDGFTVEVSGPATFSLTIVLNGHVVSTLKGGMPLELQSGSAVVFATQSTLSGTNCARGNQRLRLVDIRYSEELLASAGGIPFSRFAREIFVDGSIPDQGAVFISFPAQKELRDIATQVIECSFVEAAARKLFIQAKALEALALAIAILSQPTLKSPQLTTDDQKKLARARQILNDRFDEPWTIATLSRIVGVSERKLKAGFQTTIGNSVHEYLRNVRLSTAANMLSEGRTVTDAALSVGFDNLSHFSKIFRQQYGANPSGNARRSVRQRRDARCSPRINHSLSHERTGACLLDQERVFVACPPMAASCH